MKKLAILFTLFIGISFVSFAQGGPEYGLASFYSDKFQDRPTASGELYDKGKLTAAHKTHPYGTYIRVTRLDNKKSVVVRVNDRGPYISGRVVDVSRKAAEQLALINDGTARVKVEVVQKADNATTTTTTTAPPPAVSTPPRATTPTATTPAVTPAPPKTETVAKKEPPKTEKELAEALKKEKTDAATQPSNTGTQVTDEHAWVTLKNFQSYDLYKIELFKPEKAGYAVQVASLSSYDNAMRQIADLQGKWLKNVLISIEKGPNGTAKYRILLGPFPEREKAEGYRKSLKKRFKMDGFVVDLAALEY